MVDIIIFIVIMCISCLVCFGITYLVNNRKINRNVAIVLGITFGILTCTILDTKTYKDISAKLISKNKISSVFEVEYEKFWGLVYGNKTENIEKFIMRQPSSRLEYNDRYFIVMKLAGQDVSKYADINSNDVIYRTTLLQEIEEMEEKIKCQ